MNKKLNKKGFTLIEVVLVLAIGGLIFLLAFLAFRQASGNRRDTARRADAGRVVAEIQNFAADKNGAFPTASCTLSAAGTTATFADLMRDYLGGAAEFKDPTGVGYTCVTIAPASTGQVRYTLGSTCAAVSAGAYKVDLWVEKGLSTCRDSGQ